MTLRTASDPSAPALATRRPDMLKKHLLAPGPTPVPPEVLLAMATPIIHHRTPQFSEIFREAIRTGGQAQEFSFGIAWHSIFATVGAAMLGGLGIVVVWIWNLYRIMRGGFLLADRSPAP